MGIQARDAGGAHHAQTRLLLALLNEDIQMQSSLVIFLPLLEFTSYCASLAVVPSSKTARKSEMDLLGMSGILDGEGVIDAKEDGK